MTVKIRKTGKFFDDPQGRLLDAANRALTDIAVDGSVRVKKQLYPNHGRVTANLRNHVAGSLVKNLHARIDAGETRYGKNLVYATWVEGISSRNKTSSFKGYKMFKNVEDYIRRGSPEIDKFFEEALVEELQ
jgi:hypothetical protein